MIDRQLEPEAMDTVEDATEYDSMDHAIVNARFVADFLLARQRLGRTGSRQFVIDVGTGTARIPIELCRAQPEVRVVAIDLAREMLNVARRNVSSARLADRIALQVARVTALPFRDGSSPDVISNSLIHHLPDPPSAFRELARIVARNGLIFVRDLFRPTTEGEVEGLLKTHAADATPSQRQLLADSLRAALTLQDVRAAIAGLPLSPISLSQTSDRHWTLIAVRAS